jgi:hypothetical protein
MRLGEDPNTAVERATFMMGNWEWWSDNSVDERGHETARDGMDLDVVRLLDEALLTRYGVPNARAKVPCEPPTVDDKIINELCRVFRTTLRRIQRSITSKEGAR